MVLDDYLISAIQLPLPKGLQSAEQEHFVVELEDPKTGRASVGDERQCMVAVNNDISKLYSSVEYNSF